MNYLVSALLVDSQFLHEGININGFLFQNWLQSRQVYFHFVHQHIGLKQLGQTVLHTVPGLYMNTTPHTVYLLCIFCYADSSKFLLQQYQVKVEY